MEVGNVTINASCASLKDFEMGDHLVFRNWATESKGIEEEEEENEEVNRMNELKLNGRTLKRTQTKW